MVKKQNNPRTTQILIVLSVITVLSIFVYPFFKTTDANLTENHNYSNDLPPALFTNKHVDYLQHVKPVLEQRCIVCHGCYDAPCQLKLSSPEGIRRGSSDERIYEPRRIDSIPPSRLFIDAKTTKEWRTRGFSPILNEKEQTPTNNLNNSVLYHLLRLKKQHPQPQVSKLPDSFTLGLDREQTCPKPDAIEKFSQEHPLWGMPYAMPNLSDSEYQTLVSWVAQGAQTPLSIPPSKSVQLQIKKWETFFNQPSHKQKLVNRYLYEHLFHAHIHFTGSSNREFYRLVRSSTPPGKTINEIATVRPTDDPKTRHFYYRLLAYQPSIVSKNHIVYEFSEKRRQRFNELFLEPDYTISKQPSYDKGSNYNPFKTYAAIPAVSRYRFMLDDAHFFIEGFIKGPVCRGQLALNVIEDQFWLVFFNPDKPIITNNSEFIEKMAPQLQMPSDFDSNLDFLRIWTDYWKGQRRYMESKQAWFKKIGTHKLEHAMNFIWDGDGKNPNAALTVFRHFDSGSVSYGFVGDAPETTWVIDFPLLERIHYLLVADFDVYGNIGHRMSTRIYMDFLRMEGEDSFLAFLPVNQRKAIRDKWYIGQRSSIEKLFSAPQDWLSTKTVSDYQTSDPQKELYHHIKERLSNVLPQTKNMNLCGKVSCDKSSIKTIKRVDEAMRKISQLQGVQLHAFPDVAFVRVTTDEPQNFLTYSLIRNKAYKNVTSFLADERERDRADVKNDTMTVVNWLEGSYPNFFFNVALSDIDEFTEKCTAIQNKKDYENFVEHYGVRRTNPLFWELSDWFSDNYKKHKPISSGLFDLNRYQNR